MLMHEAVMATVTARRRPKWTREGREVEKGLTRYRIVQRVGAIIVAPATATDTVRHVYVCVCQTQ